METMWLLLPYLLIHPASAQFGVNIGKVCNCKNSRINVSDTEFNAYIQRVKSYLECPHNLVQFQFPKGTLCGLKTEIWVRKLICHLDKDKGYCVETQKYESYQDRLRNSEKGSTVIPTANPESKNQRSTTEASEGVQPQRSTPTKASMASTKPPREQIARTPTFGTILNSETYTLKGFGEFRGISTVKTDISDTRNMKTTIISLVFISILLTGIVVFLICKWKCHKDAMQFRKVSYSECNDESLVNT